MKYIYKIIKSLTKAFLSFIIIHIAGCTTLSYIPYNRNFKSSPDGVDIYLSSNGVHTDIVLPTKNQYKDWTKVINLYNTLSKDTNSSFIAFGWGDKGFYLETPSWSDLKFRIAFNAMFYLSTSAMHVTSYENIKINSTCKKITVNEEQYKKLIEYIEAGFLKNTSGDVIFIKGYHYNQHDLFYEATGKYSLFYTCNTWVNEGLKYSGMKACLWTILDKGLFYQYKNL